MFKRAFCMLHVIQNIYWLRVRSPCMHKNVSPTLYLFNVALSLARFLKDVDFCTLFCT